MCRSIVGSGMLSLFLVLPFSGAQAQSSLPRFVIDQIEAAAAEGLSAEDLVIHYEGLLARPLNLNAATRRELEASGLFTLFQQESLLAWRERYGSIRSAAELALVEGFSDECVAEIRPFVAFGEVAPVRRLTNTTTFKGRKKWKQAGMSFTAKHALEAPQWSLHAVLDNDPKERIPDFISLAGRYKGWYLGDFTARFGQGLVVWKAFSLSAFGTPSSVARRGNGLQPYRSTDESHFFRGLGWTGRFRNWSVTAFCSRNALDARIVDDSYTSIVTDGLHATEAERAKRHTLHEYVLGANLSYEKGRWHFGVTGAAYRYDKHNGRRVQDYNRYQQYDGWWGNLGADWYGTLGSLRFFGELAVDAHLAPAALLGFLWSPSYNFETSLTTRCYAPAYIATHAGAHSSLSSVSNQIGSTGSLRWIHGRWTLQADFEYVYYPWKRYRAEAGTQQFKGRLQLGYAFRSGALLQGQIAYGSQWKARLQFDLPLGATWQLGARADANLHGAGAYAGLRWHPSKKWTLATRLTAWNTRDWASRICFYEQNVPQSFAVESYSGKGIGAYLLLQYAPVRHVELSLKVQQGYLSYFVRIFMPG